MGYRMRQRGLGLIEIMVGMVIGLVAILVIGQVAAVFEGQKRTSTGGSDAQTNATAALFLLEREIRMAGLGLVTTGESGGNLYCPKGINVYRDPNVIADPGASPVGENLITPIRIVDGGSGSDVVVMARSDSDFGAMPIPIYKTASPTELIVDLDVGLQKKQLFLVGAPDGSETCTLMQLSQKPEINYTTGTPPEPEGYKLHHDTGAESPYNPADLASVFTDVPTYKLNHIVINMGSFMYRRYAVLCNQLTQVNPMEVAAPYTCGNTTPLADQVVDLQAQYGVAPAGSQTVTEWKDATGEWASNLLDDAHIRRIKAIRVAVVGRSPQLEKEDVYTCPSDLELWSGGPKMTVSGDACRYRYKILETIVPMKNVVWSQL